MDQNQNPNSGPPAPSGPQLTVIDPFYHPPAPDPQVAQRNYGNNGILDNLTALIIGSGKNSFHVDNQQGLYMGDNDASIAPFAVDMSGKATFRDQYGYTIVDPTGLRSDTQFLSSTVEDFSDRTTKFTQPFDVPFTKLSLHVGRDTNIYIFVTVTMYISGFTGGDIAADPIGTVQLKVDGALAAFKIKMQDVRMYTPTIDRSTSRVFTLSYQKLLQLTGGDHTFNLVSFLSAAGAYTLHVTQSSLSYITLGK